MNKIKKKITARFFSIKANDSFFSDFISTYNANHANDKNVRIINIKEKKHLIKIHDELAFNKNSAYFLTVVRERNTWQTRALGDGSISGIPLNQGIIGDPYYYIIIPKNKAVIGFTTGLSGSLKSVATATLQQFNKDRMSKISLDFITKENDFNQLKELSEYNNLHFKVSAKSLEETSESTPDILKKFSAAPFMENNLQLDLRFDDIGEEGFPESSLIEIVNFLSENDGCSVLTVKGLDNDGKKITLDFSNAYVTFKTVLQVRNKFIDEKMAQEILMNALNSFDFSTLANL